MTALCTSTSLRGLGARLTPCTQERHAPLARVGRAGLAATWASRAEGRVVAPLARVNSVHGCRSTIQPLALHSRSTSAPGASQSAPCPSARPARAQAVRPRAHASQSGSAPLRPPGRHCDGVTTVMKFGGSSVATASRMREVASIACSFPEHFPAVVLSAMGKTTNGLLAAGEEALRCRPSQVSRLPPLRSLRELHLATARDLGVDAACQEEVMELLTQLEQLLVGVSIMQDLTRRARDSLVSYGERLSVRLFAGYLRARGIPARAVDAPDAGVETNDAFTNAEIDYERTLPLLRESLAIAPARSSSLSESSGEEEGAVGTGGETASETPELPALPIRPLPALSREESAATGREIPVVTGFLGRARQSGAVTTLGRGGSDLTCTLLGAALGLAEVQVWKDVDGVLTGDPRIVPGARPVGELTYEEATELAFFGATVLHPLAMQPAQEVGGMAVRVKNSYNRAAPGTRIAASRDLHGALVTSIVLKQNVTLVDIVSTKMLGTYGFLARVFGVFAEHKLSVDVVATSEVSVSLTLDPAKTLWERDLIEDELEALTAGFAGIARASYRRGMSILGIICNVQRTSTILERVFNVLGREGVNVQMMSQGASKTNISLIVSDAESERVLTCLHDEFFGPAKAA